MIRDGAWRLFDYDFTTGRSVWVTDNPDGSTTVRTDYPVENIVKDNRAHLLDSHGKRWGEGRRVASIPLNIYHEQLAEAQNQKDDKYMSRWLNDSDNAAFRTFQGQV